MKGKKRLIGLALVLQGMGAWAEGTMPCATQLYSLPGQQFMHKLVTHEGETVTAVDFGSVTTLSLRDDRLHVGNRYKYVAGLAPAEEGEYSYTVHLRDAKGKDSEVKVQLTVSRFLQSPTPSMVWLTWNWFAREISHHKMVEIAHGMERCGLIKAGFKTILLDDAWAMPTSDKAALTYDPEKFPQGIAGLKSDIREVNSELRVGIYSDAGTMTCESYQPGSYLYESQHLALFDSWGVDMLKYDFCNSEASSRESYSRMGKAIDELNTRRRAEGGIPSSIMSASGAVHNPGCGVLRLAVRAGAPQAMRARTGWATTPVPACWLVWMRRAGCGCTPV